MAEIYPRRIVYGMKKILLNQRTVNVAFVVVALLVAALTADASPQPDNARSSTGFKARAAKTAVQRQEVKTLPKAKSRGSARPITNTDYIGGNQVKVRTYYGPGPM